MGQMRTVSRLLARLEQEPALTDRVNGAVLAKVGSHTPALTLEIRAMVRYNLPLVLRRLRDGRPYSEADLEPVRASARRVANLDIPAEAIAQAFDVACGTLIDAVLRMATSTERVHAVSLVTHAMALARQVSSAVSEDYEQARRAGPQNPRHGAVRWVVEQLLSGRTPQGGGGADHPVPPRAPCAVVVFDRICAGNPDRGGWRELAGEGRGGAFGIAGERGGILLVPLRHENRAGAERAALAALADLPHGTREGAVAGVSRADSWDAVGPAVREATEVVSVVRALGIPAGVYGVDAVLFGWALNGTRDRRDRLAGLLEPLADRPDLLQTLETYLAVDGDAALAARRLYVHRNTLTHRLRRIAQVTGVAPTTLRGAALLSAAVVSRRLHGERPLVVSDLLGAEIGDDGPS